MEANYDAKENQINVDLTEAELTQMLKEKWFKLGGVYIGGRLYLLSIGREI